MSLSVCQTCKNFSDQGCLAGQSYLDVVKAVYTHFDGDRRDYVASRLSACAYWQESQEYQQVSQHITLSVKGWRQVAGWPVSPQEAILLADLLTAAQSVLPTAEPGEPSSPNPEATPTVPTATGDAALRESPITPETSLEASGPLSEESGPLAESLVSEAVAAELEASELGASDLEVTEANTPESGTAEVEPSDREDLELEASELEASELETFEPVATDLYGAEVSTPEANVLELNASQLGVLEPNTVEPAAPGSEERAASETAEAEVKALEEAIAEFWDTALPETQISDQDYNSFVPAADYMGRGSGRQTHPNESPQPGFSISLPNFKVW